MALPTIHFQPFVEVSALYDTGLSNVSVTDQGQLANAASFGVGVNWGASGMHSWRHDKLGVSYRGGISHYRLQGYDSIDQSMLLSETHDFTRHIKMDVRLAGGLSNRDFGLLNMPQTVSFDPSTTYIPTTDFFDNRTYYVNSDVSLTIQKSARLSFNLAGDNVLIRRHSNSLYGMNGYTARGDAQYRVNRQSTVGANYSYLHFEYPGVLGGTDVHGFTGAYSVRLTRWTEFSGYGGVMRVESKFVQTVPLDPAIAALLGITEGRRITHTISFIPDLDLRLSRTFHTGVLYANGGHSVTPGNGLFLTSDMTRIAGGYSYTGLRRWSFGLTTDYTRSSAVGPVTGGYNGLGGGVSISRQFWRSFHLIGRVQARQYGSPDYANYNRTIYDVRVGIGFTPGDVPLRIW